MTHLPTISVVTPSFNQATFIEDTIRSVLSQDYPHVEYVVIDGGSTDGSVEIIEKYQKQLHHWASEEDHGHGHALNKGFSRTSGEIMAWLNSDDKYMPWTFGVVAEIFASFPHVNWVVGFNSWWNSKGVLTSACRMPKNIYDFLLGNYAWIQQESVFWRRSLWEKAGGTINQDFRYMVDGELWTRFFLHEELYSVDCIWAGYRAHPHNRGVRHYAECQIEMERAILAMKDKCSDQVVRTYRALERIRRLPRSNGWRRVVPAVFTKAQYKNIFFADEAWNERKLPFSV